MPKKSSSAKSPGTTATAAAPAKTVAQLKITLRYSKPAIWRRILVPHDIKLPNLHYVIQVVMGWENGHMHSFYDGKAYYQARMDDFFSVDDDDDDGQMDESKYRLSDLLARVKAKCLYIYDFGDSWEHEIVLEKLTPAEKRPAHAQALAGESACPPEDCGGIPGYYDLIKVVNNPKHPDHEEMREWLGLEGEEKFDPAAFDLAAANASLARIKI